MMKLFLLLLLYAFLTVEAYPGGAPQSTCSSMKPGHGSTPATSSPYRVEISGNVNTYTTGKTVTVCIRGENFEGLMLQARKHDGSSTVPYGSFSNLPSNTKLMSCSSSGDTVTQSSQTKKPDNTCFVWTPPSGNVGSISFIATISKSYSEYWSGLRSGAMTYQTGTTVRTTRPTTTRPTIHSGFTTTTGYPSVTTATTSSPTWNKPGFPFWYRPGVWRGNWKPWNRRWRPRYNRGRIYGHGMPWNPFCRKR